jgi:WD40 repeat protein
MSYVRKINAFGLDPSEKYAVAGNLNGELLFVDVDSFTIAREGRVCAGSIEGVDVHARAPYVAAIGSDKSLVLCKYEGASFRVVHSIDLRPIVAENESYRFVPPAFPMSQAVAFHPTERRVLSRNMSGATFEVAFDDTHYEVTWCRGYFEQPDGSAYDVAYVRYLNDTGLVFCSGRAGLVVVDPKRREEPIYRWKYDDQNIHSAEHVRGSTYLLSSDSRRVFSFDASLATEPRVGPFVCRDHMERIHYNKTSRRAFCSSFDRNVHEIDVDTLESKGVVVRTPFKLRWLQTLERAPSKMIIQCRNGALYKVDLATKKVEGVIKETPNALWSAATPDAKHVYVAGEGPEVLRITATHEDPARSETALRSEWVDLGGDRGCFTKRMIVHPKNGALVLGRSNGDVRVSDGRASRLLTNLGSAVRDLAASPSAWVLYAACEDGRAHKIDLETGRTLATLETTNDEPFWSLAYNPARDVLAVSERHGDLLLCDGGDLSVVHRVAGTSNTKRLRWYDDDRLLFNNGSSLFELRVDTGDVACVVPHQGNTIEDYAWSHDGRYFALVTYHATLAVFRMPGFEPVHATPTDMDFPHGLAWLDPARAPGSFPYEILTFGRSGVARRFRLHGERLMPLADANRELSAPVVADGISVV